MRMPRGFSQSGVYHIYCRGINRQLIFEDDIDNWKYIDKAREYCEDEGFLLLAYCLMGNHLHLLVYTGGELPSRFMKRLNCSYASFFNKKYLRTGHLFQDRFKSKAITDIKGFFRVLRYIYRNPVVAGICKDIKNYKYSSYMKEMHDLRKYLKSQGIPFENLRDYVEKSIPTDVIVDTLKYVSDEFVKKVILEIAHIKNASQFQALSKELRNIKLLALKKRGFFSKQIARVTGISIGVIESL
jgi:REP element-mobilizing transposase RayT